MYLLVIFCRETNYKILVTENNKNLLSHRFCGSGIEEQVTWVGLAHEVSIKTASKATVI